jgi:pseudooxynicotine oxidase
MRDDASGKHSRRNFMTAAGAAVIATGATVGAAAAPAGKRAGGRDHDVIVIGAGFAGLAAARELGKAGLHTLILEARTRFGGRTFTSTFADEKVELGGTWIHWSQPFVWTEAQRYGLSIVETVGAIPEHASLLYDGQLASGPAEEFWTPLAEGMAKLCNVDGQEGRTVFPRAHDPLFSGKFREFDGLSLAERLEQVKLSRREEALVACQLAINCHNDPKVGGFADQLKWWSLGDFEMGRLFDKLGRYKLREGTQGLAKAMLGDTPAEIRLGNAVKRVEVTAKGARVTSARGEVFTARSVVVAVPLNVLANIEFLPGLPAAKLEASRLGHTGRGVKFYVHVKEKIGKWLGQAPYPHPITLAWTDHERDDGTVIVAFGPPNAIDVTDEAQVYQALRTLLPGVTLTAVTGYQWATDPYSRGTWCWYHPMQLTNSFEALRAPHQCLFFASADWANGWRGFIDGAIESGLTAAREARAMLGRA